MFNPEDLMNMQTDGEMSTQAIPVPAGEHRAIIEEVAIKSVNTKNGPAVVMDVVHAIDNPTLAEELGREPKVKQSIWLDLLADNSLDRGKGKNVGLGRLREAVSQNGPKPWKPSDLIGQALTIKVVHTPSKDGNMVYANVGAVAPVS